MGNDKSKASKAPAPVAKQPAVSRTVEDAAKIRSTIQRLEKRVEFIEKKMDNELRLAKVKSKKGDKKGALVHLKRKKMYEKEVAKVQNGMMNLEQQLLTLESASVTTEIVTAMADGRNAMKAVTAGLNVDDIEDLQDDIAELNAQQNEIDEAISQPMGGLDMDEDLLEDELAQLEAEGLEEELNNLPSVPVGGVKKAEPSLNLPTAPTRKPVVVGDDDDAALAELEAEMAS